MPPPRTVIPLDPSISHLEQLPLELLLAIVEHLPHARSLAALSATCRSLHSFVSTDGWALFTSVWFPSFPLPLNLRPSDPGTSTSAKPPAPRGQRCPTNFLSLRPREAAHALTSLSRAFDRRALIASYPEPSHRIFSLPDRVERATWTRPKGQTIGFQALVDSHQLFTGGRWRDQRQVVAWGAGAEVVLWVTEGGGRHGERKAEANGWDGHGRRGEWVTYREKSMREGRHDVTALKIVKGGHVGTAGRTVDERVVVGRAMGELSLLRLGRAGGQVVEQAFQTGAATVASLDCTAGEEPIIVAGLDNDRLALFQGKSSAECAVPMSEVRCPRRESSDATCRIWSTTFLQDKGLVVGRGQCAEGIALVYGIRPEGMTAEPVRSFGTGGVGQSKTAVYPVATFAESSASDASSTDIFLSGGYDGLIRLHDMRSPLDCVSTIEDPVDSAPIFSLATVGRERAVAGGGIFNLLKFFDLRMTGGRAYSYLNLESCATASGIERPGWNLFGHSKQRGSLQSPIYSISRPSHWSTSIFAGMENQVLHLNMSSANDAHPDPMFKPQYNRHGHYSPAKTWNLDQKQVQEVSMYEQVVEGAGAFQMLKQEPIRFGRQPPRKPIAGYDERWSSNIFGRPQ